MDWLIDNLPMGKRKIIQVILTKTCQSGGPRPTFGPMTTNVHPDKLFAFPLCMIEEKRIIFPTSLSLFHFYTIFRS